MMKRGQVFIRAITEDGNWGNVDIFDVDEDTFRAIVVNILVDAGALASIRPEFVDGDYIIYRERVDSHETPQAQ